MIARNIRRAFDKELRLLWTPHGDWQRSQRDIEQMHARGEIERVLVRSRHPVGGKVEVIVLRDGEAPRPETVPQREIRCGWHMRFAHLEHM